MSRNVIVKRNEATNEVLDEIYRVIRKIASRFPESEVKVLFYTEQEIEEIKRKKKKWNIWKE